MENPAIPDLLMKIRTEFGEIATSQTGLGDWLVKEQGFIVENYKKDFSDYPDIRYRKGDTVVSLKETSYIQDDKNHFVVFRAEDRDGRAYVNLTPPDNRKLAA